MTFTHASVKYVPVPVFDMWFRKNVKFIMKGYTEYCVDLGHNVPLHAFSQALWNDYVFGNQVHLN